MLILSGRYVLDSVTERVPVAFVDGDAFYADDPPRWVSLEAFSGDEYDEPEDAL